MTLDVEELHLELSVIYEQAEEFEKSLFHSQEYLNLSKLH